jgi:hypothetical protein
MEFVQYSKSIIDYIIFEIVIGLSGLYILYTDRLNVDKVLQVFTVTVLLVSMITFCLLIRNERKKIIYINENGISLTRQGKPEWEFAWKEIHWISCGSADGHRCVFIGKNCPAIKLSSLVRPYPYAFHLNKTAQEALERYCPLPIEK